MEFQVILNEYMEALSCTGKELAEASGLSASVVSRYRTGRRVPDAGGTYFRRLIDGIAALAEERGLAQINAAVAEAALRDALRREAAPDRSGFHRRLDALLSAFRISNNELARFLNFDASYLSRIRSGRRTPADIPAFAENVGLYITRRFQEDGDRTLLRETTGRSPAPEEGDAGYVRAVAAYLCQEEPTRAT